MFEVMPLTGKKWLICGGRDFEDADMFNAAMSDLTRKFGCPSIIIHGGAAGADQLADIWAFKKSLMVRRFGAKWKKYGRAAGPIRNQQMIDEGKPDFVVAFPGGNGTADMIMKARAADIDVAEIKPMKESQ